MLMTPSRVWPVGLFSLALLAVFACGPGPGSGAPPPPDGSTGGMDPGAGGGSGSDPGAPGGSGGTSGSSPGGSQSEACAGLIPIFDDAVDLKLDTGTHNTCLVATSAPSGQVALGVGNASGIQVRLHSADGREQGRIDGLLQRFVPGGQDIDPWFHWTSSGYHGIVHPGRVSFPTPFETWDTSGSFVAETGSATLCSAPDSSGGSIILTRAQVASGDSFTLGPTQLQWVDASGGVTRSVTLDRDATFVLSNWGTGHVVAVVAGTGASARWFDGAGNAITPWFGVGDVSVASAHLLVDGTIVLEDSDGWRVALRDGVASGGAVPDWLAARPRTRLATIRHARGYAVLPFEAADSTRFEIVTATGESCGSVAIPPPVLAAGETRVAGRLDVGQDGTLLEVSGIGLATPSFGVHCAFRWWPALLR